MPDSINIDQLISQFLHKLKREQFSIGTDSFIQTTRMLKWFVEEKKDERLDAFSYYLAPVLCKNDKEQADFLRLFKTDFLPGLIKIEEEKKNIRKQKIRKWLIINCIVLVLLATSLFLYHKIISPSPPAINYARLIEQPYFVHKLHLADFNAGRVFKKEADTADFKIIYKYSDGKVKIGAAVTHSFNKYGIDSFWVNYKSGKYNIDTTVLYRNINVGPEQRELIIPETEFAVAGESTSYSTEADTASVKKFYWLIDSVRQPAAERQLSHVFAKRGDYLIELHYDIENDSFLKKFPEEFIKGTYLQKVVADSILLNAELSGLPELQKTSVNKAWLFSLIILMAGLIVAAIKRFNKKLKMTLYECSEENFPGDKPPYDIPFISKEQNINPSYALQRLSNDLKKRTESQAYSINLDKTINYSINNRGFISPQYSQKQVNREYLFLIDYAYANSQQVKLFTYLVKYFITRSVQIDFYFYHQQPDKFFRHAEGSRMSPTQMKDRHYNATLIFITEGTGLTDWQQPVVRNDIMSNFGFWQNRLLVTPVPAADWSGNEKILSQFFKLLPADIEGLLELVRLIEEDGNQGAIQGRFSTYTARHKDFNNINDLQNYLDNDAELFQWICAAAILPKIYWEFLLEAGKTIVSDSTKINYDTLLKLVRINWVHQGSIPPSVRLELLKKLTVENELAARMTLLRMLDEAPVDEESFSFEEKQVIWYSSSFILLASDKEQYKDDRRIQEGENKFICLYKKNKLLDSPFRIYIEKKEAAGGDWETPIHTDGKNGGIEEYIHEKELGLKNELRNKRWQKYRIAGTYLAGALGILLWLINLLVNKDRIANDSKNPFRLFIDAARVEDSRVIARIMPWECINDLLSSSGDSVVGLELSDNGKTLYSGKLKAGDTSLIQLSVKQVQNGNVSPSPSGGTKFILNINGQKFETAAQLQPGIFDISLAGNCDTASSAILIDYYPGFADDTNAVKNILREMTEKVNTFEGNGKVQFANSVFFEDNVDTEYVHRLCMNLIKAGLSLKRVVELGITDPSQRPRSSRRKRIVIRADERLDNLPKITADSIDCRFMNIKCKEAPVANKSLVTIFYNNRGLADKIKQVNRCIGNRSGFDVNREKFDNNFSQSLIRYYRNSFADSVTLLMNCVSNYAPGSISIQKTTRPLAENAAAEVLVNYAPDQPELTIAISDESLRNSADQFSKNLSASGYIVKGINIGTRSYNSVIEYYDAGISQQASQVRDIYRRYFPDLPIEARFISTRAPRKSIIVWIQKYAPPIPTYKIQNVKFPNEITNKEKFEITFEVNSSNVPVSVSQNRINKIDGTICIYSQQTNCAAFSIDEGNGIEYVSKQMDVSTIRPGRHEVRVRINEMKIDTLLGSFNIKEEIPPQAACDTIESYIGSGSIKTYINTPLYKDHGIELSLTQNASDDSYGVFSIVYDRCKYNKTQTIKTGERVSIEFCDGMQLTLWLQKWENREGNVRNKEAVFEAAICEAESKRATRK